MSQTTKLETYLAKYFKRNSNLFDRHDSFNTIQTQEQVNNCLIMKSINI